MGLMNAARALQSAENFVVARRRLAIFGGSAMGTRNGDGRKEAFEEETQEAAAADAVGKVGEDGGSEGGGGGCWLGGGSFRRGEG